MNQYIIQMVIAVPMSRHQARRDATAALQFAWEYGANNVILSGYSVLCSLTFLKLIRIEGLKENFIAFGG